MTRSKTVEQEGQKTNMRKLVIKKAFHRDVNWLMKILFLLLSECRG